MKIDIHAAAEKLASDPGLTDYDFWRTLKNLDIRDISARQQ